MGRDSLSSSSAKAEDPRLPAVRLKRRGWSAFADHDESASRSVNLFGVWYQTLAAGFWRPAGWTAWRDRLLSSARFQRFAVAFPLTRPIARRRARALFDVVAGFVYSQVLFACVRLRLFDVLAAGPQTVPALAARLALPEDAALRLLEAAASLRLAERRRDGRFGLGDLGAAMVANPGIGAMVEHHAMLYADLRDPVALLRGEAGETALGAYWPYAHAESRVDADGAAPYTALMAASQALVADEVLDAYPIRRHRCVLDIGGGDGSFLRAVARRAPGLQLKLFDLPPVAAMAERSFAAAGLASRADVTGGSFLADKLPTGADIATLVRVLHDHDDDSVLTILHAARRALPDDGTLLIAEPMAETGGAEPVGAYFGFYLLAMGSGRPRTPAALTSLLERAGFGQVRLLPTRRPLLARVMTARPSRGGV
jgi:demethylspheroidene O-methyltransferase